MEFSRSEYWSGKPFPSPGDFPNPRIEHRSPALQAGCLPAEPQRKSKNTGVASLSLLQQIFLTQESNQGLLYCKWMLFVGNLGLIPGLGRSPGEWKHYPLQYSGLENSMGCIVHGVAKSWTRLSHFRFSLTVYIHKMGCCEDPTDGFT